MKTLRTWALIADGARARILENTGRLFGEAGHIENAHEWKPVPGMSFHGDHHASHGPKSDEPSHAVPSGSDGHTMPDADASPGRGMKAKFAHQLAGLLDENMAQGLFHRLIIAAPPAMLGDLRSSLSSRVQASVVGEFAHDLTKMPDHDMSLHLRPLKLG